MSETNRHDSAPNVLIIIMDDLCYGDLACHGNPFTRTPELDRLHGESIRLTRHCSGPLCSPARASLMTGRYHLRTRVVDTYCGRSMMDPTEATVAHAFSSAGYATGCFGKWHLGDNAPNRPQDMGFHETLIHKGGGIGQFGDHPGNLGRESYFDPFLYENGVARQFNGYCTDIFAEATAAFIRKHRDEPFFAYLATNAPHAPLQVADNWADPYRRMNLPEEHARLYGMVENIDWNVGGILHTLDTLGLAGNTLVFYTSDHGPCNSARAVNEPPERQHRYNCGLRGLKGTVYEGGIRVPAFLRWPDRLKAGRDVDLPTHAIDLLPTLCAACGVAAPQASLDGLDLLPLLAGETSEETWPKRALFMQWHRGDAPTPHRNRAVITRRHKLIRCAESGEDELYDLLVDPSETTSIASSEPALVAELRQRYTEWLTDVSATRPDNYAPPPIYIGSHRQAVTELTRHDWRVHGLDGWGRPPSATGKRKS